VALFLYCNMSFSKHILSFYRSLKNDWLLPKDIELLYPFENIIVMDMMEKFYNKFYNDTNSRYFLFGINPGRLGAGMTGIPFTDPIALAEKCGIPNDIKGKHELSSIFIYDMINTFGSVEKFYSQYYISSICPLGFTKHGRNYNYYDDKILLSHVEPKIIESIEKQISKFCKTNKSFSLGQGKNYKYFLKLNEKYNWFEEVIPLPHPRWVMQYKRKSMQTYLDEYMLKLKF